MDSDKNKAQQQPEQNQLDLEFNQMEPITPKKVVEPTPSFLDKIKGVMAGLGRKKQEKTRQEPTLTQATNEGQADLVENETSLDESSETLQHQEENTPLTESKSKGFDWKHPENWAILQKLPQKHRRIVAVLFALIILLLLFLWLKPSSTTVDSFHQQSQNQLPIEFQPLDQSLIVEENEPEIEMVVTEQVQFTAPSLMTTAANIASGVVLPKAEVNHIVAEEVAPQTKTITSPVRQTESVKTSPTQEQKPATKAVQNTAKSTPRPATSRPVENKQSANKPAPVVEASRAKASSRSTGTNKTLTISKGVSLMQVFRDNNLNIADVNAMTRANGAGNVLSSFKPGDKVQVSVQSNGRVGELRLQDGSRFIRQADGSYIYRK